MKKYLAATLIFVLLVLGVKYIAVIVLADENNLEALQQELLSFSKAALARAPINREPLSLERAKAVSTARKQEMLKLAKENPDRFLRFALPKAQRVQLPAVVQIDLEQEVELQGNLDVVQVDDFEHPENSSLKYFLNQNGRRTEVYPTTELLFIPGTSVALNGFQIDRAVVINTNLAANARILAAAPPPESVGDQKTLVILIRSTGAGLPPFTRARAHDLVFNGQFAKFMEEQSYGKVSFSGDVYGWLSLDDIPDFFSIDEISEISQFISQNNIDLNRYGRVLYLVDSKHLGGSSNVGKQNYLVNGEEHRFSKSQIGLAYYNLPASRPFIWRGQPFSWTVLDDSLAHELGHALGARHAKGLDCGTEILKSDCRPIEYGNFFDAMGGSDAEVDSGIGFSINYSLHFGAFYKEKLGWLDPNLVLTITKSGLYAINNLESANGVRAAKIQLPGSDSPTFYLETRRGVGFDSRLGTSELTANQNGLFINKITKDSRNPPHHYLRLYSWLLDMSPTDQDWRNDLKDAVLHDGSTFFDPESGVTIRSLLSNNNSTLFGVAFGAAQPNPSGLPTLSLGDISVKEGNSFLTEVKLNVTLSSPSATDISAYFDTFDESAKGNDDDYHTFPSGAGSLSIPAGQTSATFNVFVKGDTAAESDEYFLVRLSNPTGATLAKAEARVTIQNDDIGPSVLNSANVTCSDDGPKSVTLDWTGQPALDGYFTLAIRDLTAVGIDGPFWNRQFLAPLGTPEHYQDTAANGALPNPGSVGVVPLNLVNGNPYDAWIYTGPSSNMVKFSPNCVPLPPPPPPPPPELTAITIVSPNGGEILRKNSAEEIVWSFTPASFRELADIKLISRDGKISPVAQNASRSHGSYYWTVGVSGKAVPAGSYKMEICGRENKNICDRSDSYFVIVDDTPPPPPPPPTLPAPTTLPPAPGPR